MIYWHECVSKGILINGLYQVSKNTVSKRFLKFGNRCLEKNTNSKTCNWTNPNKLVDPHREWWWCKKSYYRYLGIPNLWPWNIKKRFRIVYAAFCLNRERQYICSHVIHSGQYWHFRFYLHRFPVRELYIRN